MSADTGCCGPCDQRLIPANLVTTSTTAANAVAADGFTAIHSDDGSYRVYDCGTWVTCSGKLGMIAVAIVDGKPVMHFNSGSTWISFASILRAQIAADVEAIDFAALPEFCNIVKSCVPTPAPTPAPSPAPSPGGIACTSSPNLNGLSNAVAASGDTDLAINEPIESFTGKTAGFDLTITSNGLRFTNVDTSLAPVGANGERYWSVNVTNQCGTNTLSGGFE